MQKNLQTTFDNLTIAGYIRAKMEARRLTLAQVSEMTGVDISQVARFRKAQFKRESPNLSAVCMFLGIHVVGKKQHQSEVVPTLAIRALHAVWDGSAGHEIALAQLIDRVGLLLLSSETAKK